jgi:hypothetical protein
MCNICKGLFWGYVLEGNIDYVYLYKIHYTRNWSWKMYLNSLLCRSLRYHKKGEAYNNCVLRLVKLERKERFVAAAWV